VSHTAESSARSPYRLAFEASRVVVALGFLLAFGALSLPFVSAEGFRQPSVAGDGLISLLLLAPVFAMTLVPAHRHPLPRPLAWASLALTAVALPYTVLKYLDAATLAATLRGSVGAGARLLVVGACIMPAGLVLGLIRVRLYPPPAASQAAAVHPAPEARSPRVPRVRPPARPAASPPASQWRRRPGEVRAGEPAVSPARVPGSAPDHPDRPARREPAPLRAADPDTEPTLPAQRPVQPWWPDDLDDLFS